MKYSDPINQIQDQIGALVVTFYLKDVEIVAEQIEANFKKIESKDIVPDSESEFGYVGKTLILFLQPTCSATKVKRTMRQPFSSCRSRLCFSTLGPETNHDLGYKPELQLTRDQKRHVAYVAAQAWGADRILDDLHDSATAKTVDANGC